ncbi:MAG: rod-binding protein [bacterium]|nr:rod-binding protein [bacterium]
MDSVPDIRHINSSDPLNYHKSKIDGGEPPEIISKKKKLMEAAEGFESMFVNMLLKQMRQTIPDSELIDGGYAGKIFEEMFDEEISKKIASRGGLGISHAIYKKFEQSLPSPETKGYYEEHGE